jgi:hypothetical protein
MGWILPERGIGKKREHTEAAMYDRCEDVSWKLRPGYG